MDCVLKYIENRCRFLVKVLKDMERERLPGNELGRARDEIKQYKRAIAILTKKEKTKGRRL